MLFSQIYTFRRRNQWDLWRYTQAVIDEALQWDHLFMMVDFNWKVGKLNQSFPSSTEKYTTSRFNSRWELRAQFYSKNSQQITNTRHIVLVICWLFLLCLKKKKQLTWISTDSITKYQIVFIIPRKSSSWLIIRQNCS